MATLPSASATRTTSHWNDAATRIAPGLAVATTIAMAARFAADLSGGPVMLYALLIGMALSFLADDVRCRKGVDIAAKTVLRVGVALLGIQLTAQDVVALGWEAAALVVACVVVTITGGSLVGRALRLNGALPVLAAGATAICGASAALAISAVLPRRPESERQTVLVVAAVTTLSTIAMLVYPTVAQLLGLDDRSAGIFIGATIHDVAQVVGAGYMISDEAGQTATVIKLMRVACLVPAVATIGLLFRARSNDDAAKMPSLLPWFLVAFLALMFVNSLGAVPAVVVDGLKEGSRWCLAVAIAALGLKTRPRELFAMGARPILMLVMQTLLLATLGLAAVILLI